MQADKFNGFLDMLTGMPNGGFMPDAQAQSDVLSEVGDWGADRPGSPRDDYFRRAIEGSSNMEEFTDSIVNLIDAHNEERQKAGKTAWNPSIDWFTDRAARYFAPSDRLDPGVAQLAQLRFGGGDPMALLAMLGGGR
jgi:hypothetical protein